MSVKVLSEKVRELVDEDAEVEQIATGFTFTEGPIWMDDGSLHFSDMPGDKRRRWHPQEGAEGLRAPGDTGNGRAGDPARTRAPKGARVSGRADGTPGTPGTASTMPISAQNTMRWSTRGWVSAWTCRYTARSNKEEKAVMQQVSKQFVATRRRPPGAVWRRPPPK